MKTNRLRAHVLTVIVCYAFLQLLLLRTTRRDQETKAKEGSLLLNRLREGAPQHIFFIFLSLQCGCQPLLVKFFMPTTVVRSTAVVGQEMFKLSISMLFLSFSGSWASATEKWTFTNSLKLAGAPSLLFVIQNYCNLMANQTLPPVTFAVLNQTKTLSTAFCCFLLLGQKQSDRQVIALVLLVFATLVTQRIFPLSCATSGDQGLLGKNKADLGLKRRRDELQSLLINQEQTEDAVLDEMDVKESIDEDNEAMQMLRSGVLPALLASFLSGLAGTLTQKTLQTFHQSPHLFNAELAVMSSCFVLLSLATGSPDQQRIAEGGVFQGWTWKTCIPLVTNGLGGILVGLVTKYQGAVVKGFASIFGIVISGILQHVFLAQKGESVTVEQFVGGLIGSFSLWLHIVSPT